MLTLKSLKNMNMFIRIESFGAKKYINLKMESIPNRSVHIQ